MNNGDSRSTIGLRMSTKARLDKSRAPGQCYDGFLCQLVDMWDKAHGSANATMAATPKQHLE
ncbi:MAG: hypothetical protein PHU52_00995 [Dehalococcoidales bacterium]|jgi:hypothetical protein|nr:hypothetical protein [Dehalococcoidales bacterium]